VTRFEPGEMAKAYAHADEGGQALVIIPRRAVEGPRCFRKYSEYAYLMDRDAARLKRTARKLGVRVIKIDRPGETGQHVDLCGKPLERARLVASGGDAENRLMATLAKGEIP
jgi:hypothetical protein